MSAAADILIKKGLELDAQPYEFIQFAYHDEADQLLNDLEHYPHAYVLACLMDRQTKSERAWMIPHKIKETLGDFELSTLLSLDQVKYVELFKRESLHRRHTQMAESFYLGVQRIETHYGGDASAIWKGKPTSATVIQRFRQFHGAGPKIASMAANILVRNFKIPLADRINIDISPDVHVLRVFFRLGLIDDQEDTSAPIYSARGLYPTYPGVFDLSVWEIGREWCRPSNPACDQCYLNDHCPKVGVR